MEETTRSPQAGTNMDDVKSFYKESLPKIFKAVLFEPIAGTYALLSTKSEKNSTNSIILIVSTGILYILIPYLVAGDLRSFVPFKYFLFLGIGAMLCLLIISVLSFLIKSVSGKADFKNELLTGGLCGIPFSILIIFGGILFMFSSNKLGRPDPLSFFSGGYVIMLITAYILLSMINIFQQSLKSSGTKDALAWYLSPVSIFFSLWLTEKIMEMMMK